MLLDSTAPKPGPHPPAQAASYDLIARIVTLLPAAAHLGAAHLTGDPYDSLPRRSRDETRASVSTACTVQSYINEYLQGATAMHQAAALDNFAAKPLIVITAGRNHDATWMAAQTKLTTLSINSRHRVVPDATHGSLVLKEDNAAAASQAIRDVVDAVRTSQPLA